MYEIKAKNTEFKEFYDGILSGANSSKEARILKKVIEFVVEYHEEKMREERRHKRLNKDMVVKSSLKSNGEIMSDARGRAEMFIKLSVWPGYKFVFADNKVVFRINRAGINRERLFGEPIFENAVKAVCGQDIGAEVKELKVEPGRSLRWVYEEGQEQEEGQKDVRPGETGVYPAVVGSTTQTALPGATGGTGPPVGVCNDQRLRSEVTVSKRWETGPEGVGNMVLPLGRSDMFAPTRRGARRMRDYELLASRDDERMFYTGHQLDQADADVWMYCVNIGRSVPLGEMIFFNRAEALKAIGRAKGKQNYEWLISSMKRLKAAAVYIETGRYVGGFGLLSFGHDKETGQYFIRLDPELKKIADLSLFAYIDLDQRRQIPHSNQLAKWVQFVACSHKAGCWMLPTKLTDLHAWSGQKSELKDFKRRFIEAVKINEKVGVIKNWKVEDGKISWYRSKHNEEDGKNISGMIKKISLRMRMTGTNKRR